MNDKIFFEKENPSDKIWHVEHAAVPEGGGPAVRDVGRLEISFDKKKIYADCKIKLNTVPIQ